MKAETKDSTIKQNGGEGFQVKMHLTTKLILLTVLTLAAAKCRCQRGTFRTG